MRPPRPCSKARNTTMKKIFSFCAITSLLLGEAAAEDRVDRIDLTGFTCRQFLAMKRDDALIVVKLRLRTMKHAGRSDFWHFRHFSPQRTDQVSATAAKPPQLVVAGFGTVGLRTRGGTCCGLRA